MRDQKLLLEDILSSKELYKEIDNAFGLSQAASLKKSLLADNHLPR